MVNLEHLRARGLWAYEAGRVRMASRIALIVIPAWRICLARGWGPRGVRLRVARAARTSATWLRWRDRRGTDGRHDRPSPQAAFPSRPGPFRRTWAFAAACRADRRPFASDSLSAEVGPGAGAVISPARKRCRQRELASGAGSSLACGPCSPRA